MQIIGSGFFVGKSGYFVTAAHVAKAVQDSGKASPPKIGTILIPQRVWPRAGQDIGALAETFGFQLIEADAEQDIALCKTVRNPFDHPTTKNFVLPAVLEQDIPPDGTRLGFVGFPLNLPLPVFGEAMLSSDQHLPAGDVRGFLLMIQAASWGGMSGAPLFLHDGRVIAVMLGSGTGPGQGLALARAVRLIVPLIEKHKAGQ